MSLTAAAPPLSQQNVVVNYPKIRTPDTTAIEGSLSYVGRDAKWWLFGTVDASGRLL